MSNGVNEDTGVILRRIGELEAVFKLIKKYPLLSVVFVLGLGAYHYFHHVRDPVGSRLDELGVQVEERLDSLGGRMEQRLDAMEIQVARLEQAVQDLSSPE